MLKPGTKVKKISNKPFKSQRRINTIKGVTDHPHVIGQKAYTFEEDDSYVSACLVEPLTKEEKDNGN